MSIDKNFYSKELFQLQPDDKFKLEHPSNPAIFKSSSLRKEVCLNFDGKPLLFSFSELNVDGGVIVASDKLIFKLFLTRDEVLRVFLLTKDEETKKYPGFREMALQFCQN